MGFRAVTGVANRGDFEIKAVSPSVSIVTLHFEFELPRGPVGAIARFLPVDRIIDRYAEKALVRLVHKLESLDVTPAEPSLEPTQAGAAETEQIKPTETGEP